MLVQVALPIARAASPPVRGGGAGRRARARRAIGVVLSAGVAFALAGCGSAATSTPSGAPTASVAPIPEASFTGGAASARLDLPIPAAWDGGWCTRGVGDAWLALNIGYPNGGEYFGLVVGRSAYLPDATRDAAEGGTFGGDDVAITWRHAGDDATLAPAGLVLELAKDLSIGTFSGRLADGTEVRGSFACTG